MKLWAIILSVVSVVVALALVLIDNTPIGLKNSTMFGVIGLITLCVTLAFYGNFEELNTKPKE